MFEVEHPPAALFSPAYFSTVRKTLKAIAVEYGSIAVVVYLAIFALVLVGFWSAVRFGWSASSTTANVGAWTAAYIATKLTQPLRIVATVAVTPLVARVFERFTRKRSAPPSPDSTASPPGDA